MKLLIIFFISAASALHCDKAFNYFDNYGNGFDVICQGLTTEHIYILKNISISHEIGLYIENSALAKVDAELFHKISHLKNLFIRNSIFSFSENEQIFKYLNSLENMEIRNTVMQVSKDTFTGLNHLKNLVMSNNSLTTIEEGSFEHVPNLRKIEITSNKIKNMGDIPLCEIKDLDALNLSSNSISMLTLPHFHCRISDTQSQPFQLNLNNQKHTLKIAENKYEDVADFGLTLTHVDLSHNKISEVGDTLANMKLIRKLRLQGNSLKRLKTSDLANLNDLEEIFLQNNELEIIDEKLFDKKVNLKYIDISYNKLTKFDINEVSSLEHLNLEHNSLSNFTIGSLKTRKSLRTLILNNNKFREISLYTFRWLSSLELLNLANNGIKPSKHFLKGLIHLKDLILMNNSIEEVTSDMFSDLTQLKILDISSNNLKALIYNPFQYLTNLETLNISYNLLDVVEHQIFKPLWNLRTLDISGNRLKNIEYKLILPHLNFLSVFEIKANLLSCEILTDLIHNLKMKNIAYTALEKFDFEKENVGGIYCSSEIKSLNVVSNVENKTGSVFVNISVAISLMLIVSVLGVAVYRLFIYMKRRKYRPDEFELIN